MNGKRRPKPGSVLWGARKFLVILLLIKLQQLCWLAAAIQTGNDTIDISWVFSLKSVSRMVPLQQHTEASRRLQDILTGDSLNFDRPITILLHQSPLQSHQQLLLFHASREAFAEEERLMPGIFVSHFRTLLLLVFAGCDALVGDVVLSQFVVNAASDVSKDAREVLRVGLKNAGLVNRFLDLGDEEETVKHSKLPFYGQKDLAKEYSEAVASAEAFVRDLQRVFTSRTKRALATEGVAEMC
ncbi:hypothetical protein cyc_05380 [Cyclospora cayetanensis]|uniref:Uncharacterized protein n=1 Tax=Cyclospora cayetanensis TaxID=88456 RepID=A0A1D3D362_9EIME|nr:hypothetical protein cyc_05380 [Cyclospora cayetanensis]